MRTVICVLGLTLAVALSTAWVPGSSGSALAGQAVVGGCSVCGHPPQHPWHYRNCRYYGLGLNSGGGGAPAANPQAQMMQMMMPVLQNALQNMWNNQPTLDPQEQARRQAAAAEAARQAAEQAEVRRAEEERRRREAFERLKKELKLSEDFGDLKLKLSEPEDPPKLKLGDDPAGDDGLRPKGTPLFGLGGDAGSPLPPEPTGDPMVVDLRNCRRGAFLAGAAEKASGEDSDRLMNEAVRAAMGDASLVAEAPKDAAPAVSEAGLKAFQVASRRYRLAWDSRLRQDPLFRQAQLRWELAEKAVRFRRAELEKQLAEKLATASLEEKHKLFGELTAAARVEREAWEQAQAEAAAAGSREAFEKAVLGATLKTVAVSAPATLPETLRREREALEPSLADRARHWAFERLAREEALDWELYVGKNYLPAANRELTARVQRLADRVRGVSLYPGQPAKVVVVGAPRDANADDPYTMNCTSTTVYAGEGFLKRNFSGPGGDDRLLFALGHETAHVQRDHYYLAVKAYDREARTLDELLGAL
ncbi:MAG TPA: hypothetical protein PK280_14660, partial [Planctomycetota bacterium]|nr:hypothetical protein [Planctomycetota bacterium]